MKVILSKKNPDGSYDTSRFLFDGIDMYHGDLVSKILELAPADDGSRPRKVKIQLVCKQDGIDYEFVPIDDDGFHLKTTQYPGLTIWFEDNSGVKYRADRNGIISLINELTTPLTLKMWVKAEPYTLPKLVEGVVLSDISFIVWGI
ncbi:hypothetical protein [Fusobacterium necrophorum]|jgi:hypothetical protein|uniref:Uncharacterized protein n=1 Tax=Fusobacterium necrophorum subsp. funduliforme TaxID=143387 RepID=A0A162J863_9FUSO|nr:hypothetical protein [Fusobacterium necrophorum]AVQ21478.1 hypothetical protein C4N15_07375 [Fusobacterium necrophorum subsp. funduliforme]EHO19622.1 hypothetical protein HMPREF9466_01553 [Fusobacterium necrophorum subsp. funduliforme 1_1_36S]KYL05315.1 hypothetical protein A2J07_00840 [Fusobacterium necrophorum subsp. funduliforme]MDK4523143.1 hypothetical protein [Fusobacterium necrophorum]